MPQRTTVRYLEDQWLRRMVRLHGKHIPRNRRAVDSLDHYMRSLIARVREEKRRGK